MSTDQMIDLMAERDDWLEAAAHQLSAERYERSLSALYSAAMLGLPDEDLRHLCAECGVQWRDLDAYQPPLLRLPKEKAPTLELPF